MNPRTCLAIASAAVACVAWVAPSHGGAAQRIPGASVVSLKERTDERTESGNWNTVERVVTVDPKRTAIIICDMWDNHWCRGAAGRVRKLAVRMVPVLDVARKHGVLIIHAPSETMDFYKSAPQRQRAESATLVSPSSSKPITEPPLPIDFADGGCDTSPPDKFYKAWTRENAIIPIMPSDLISTDGSEIYSNLSARNIDTVAYVGVHANMCILNRPFAIRQMRQWGLHCLLIRDLTDAMYNPSDAPRVSHEQGTDLVIRHIERYLAPSILSTDLVNALGRAE